MKKIKALLLNDRFILLLIVINAIAIFLQGFELMPVLTSAITQIDNIITIVFLLELAIKVSTYSLRGFLRSKWNIFDAVLIILALPSLYYWFFANTSSDLDFLLVLRVTRVFKFFRFLRFFPDIDNLINGVSRALKASVVVLIGFFVYNFVVSVLSCFLFRGISPEHFSDPIISFYSIFRVFTIEGWYEIPDDIAMNSSQTIAFLTKAYFIIIVLTGGIFGLSLVNSIFVDAMVSDNNDELVEKVVSLESKIDILLEKVGESK